MACGRKHWILLCFLLPFVTGCVKGPSSSDHVLSMDEALLTVHNRLSEEITVTYISDYCYKCVEQTLMTVKDGPKNLSVVINTHFSLTLFVKVDNMTRCSWTQMYGEGGEYSVWVDDSELSNITCSRADDKSPNKIYIPILIAVILMIVLTVIAVSVPYLYRWHYTSRCLNTMLCRNPDESENARDPNEQGESKKPKSSRLKSLDTFRGLSVTIMIFVNYEAGGYWFFQHTPWNGFTIADCVMPWFVFIMGTSVVLAFNAMWRRGVSRLQLLRKITWRSVVLILIGFCFMNYSPRDGPLSLSWVRVPGVLQRLGFTYFVLTLMHMSCLRKNIPLSEYHWWNPLQDTVLYWPEWIVIVLLEILWLCLTFLLPVPGCPTGYLGAGGIGDSGLYPNCTGGAAGYIDRWILGDNIYRYPTCKKLYRTTQPFDPEGILGTINSVVMGFAGMQAGKILIYFRKRNFSVLKRYLIWAVILGIFAAILSKCVQDEGFIPVNKNLWSLSYVSCMSAFSFVLLGLMYFIIDVKGWWGGQPFIYPGMNSIFVYVGHSLLGAYFPFSWEMSRRNHAELLFQSLLGTTLWVFIAYLLYRKTFFLKI